MCCGWCHTLDHVYFLSTIPVHLIAARSKPENRSQNPHFTKKSNGWTRYITKLYHCEWRLKKRILKSAIQASEFEAFSQPNSGNFIDQLGDASLFYTGYRQHRGLQQLPVGEVAQLSSATKMTLRMSSVEFPNPIWRIFQM